MTFKNACTLGYKTSSGASVPCDSTCGTLGPCLCPCHDEPKDEALCRVHLGMIHSTAGDYWELRVSPHRGTGVIARMHFTFDQFSSLMSGELVTDVGLDVPAVEEQPDGYLGAWCPQCGPVEKVDEDGCCVSCGCTAVGDGVDEVLKLLRAHQSPFKHSVPMDDELLKLFGEGQDSYEGWGIIWRAAEKAERERLVHLAHHKHSAEHSREACLMCAEWREIKQRVTDTPGKAS